MTNKLASLEDLPEFATYAEKLFGSGAELPAYEIARLVFKQNHHVEKPFRPETVVYVVGRSVNQGPVKGEKEYTIFCASRAIKRIDSTSIVVNSSGRGVSSAKLDAYEILKPHDELYPLKNLREL